MLKGFEGQKHAELYAKFRPTYPTEVAEKAVEFARKNKGDGELLHMVDVGCGNGQSTEMYGPYFEKITAIDTSERQIEQAKKSAQKNIHYVTANAEDLPVGDNSVDVICSGQAIHWVDFAKFWNECRRVLKEDGSLVLYGYDMPHVVPADESQDREILKRKSRRLTLKLHEECKFHERIDHVNNLYVEIYDMIPSADKHRDDTLRIEREWDVQQLGNYLSTWSGYQTYLRERGGENRSPDILRQYLDGLKQLYGKATAKDDEVPVLVTWDIFMIFSKRPV